MLLPALALVIAQRTTDIPILSGLGISGVTQGGRAPVGIDTVQSLIVEDKWQEPRAGDKVPGARGGDRAWAEVKANKDGVFEGGATGGGYIFASVDSDAEKPMLLQAAGDTMVYINGEPRTGDPYSYGYLRLPFLMKKGHNQFLFSCGRGRLQAKLIEAKPVELNVDDLTLPDILTQDKQENYLGAIPVINATTSYLGGFHFVCEVDGNKESSPVATVSPMTLRKCPFVIPAGSRSPGDHKVKLTMIPRTANEPVAVAEFTISVRKPTEHYKRTFLSTIDGSVQYFGVCPSLKPSKDNALIMTVHGASVEGIGQARAYQPKDWCTIVAPTNRRPYGFDWEDWGRMDGMEVWNLAKKEFPHDPQRVILTGHSMGGHGTWTLGLTYPGEFAAIGPSAGWISFWSYAGGWEPRDPNPVEQMLRRSMNSSDTLLMINNAKMEDVFILHGDKDDNVPVEQARTMKANLEKIGVTPQYHEEPGAGHWWGNQCVDWPPMFEMFSKARLNSVRETAVAERLTPVRNRFDFTTVNPGVSASCGEFSIEQQIDPLKPSRVSGARTAMGWEIKTENVRALSYGSDPVTIDGKMPGGFVMSVDPHYWGARTYATKDGDTWTASKVDPSGGKSAGRSGPFKLAFQNRMVLIVGTHGTSEENAWALNKARFDAESWYYRGNGAVDVITDDEVGRYKDRNLILYGNADTNKAFSLVAKSPIQVSRGSIKIGDHTAGGDNAAVVFLYPQGKRMIGVVGGTGMKGLLYSDRLPYFTSGVAYPDWAIFRTTALSQGSKRVIGAGFFDNEWKFDAKQSAFLDE
jgi:dienelactone hydrolase